MGFLDDLGARLLSSSLASSSGVNGWVLYKSYLPDSTAGPDKAVALIETPGGPPWTRAEIDQPSVQVAVRGANINATASAYSDAQAEADAIKRDLHAITLTSSSGRYYVSIQAQQDPFLLEYDAQKRPVLVFNMWARRSRT